MIVDLLVLLTVNAACFLGGYTYCKAHRPHRRVGHDIDPHGEPVGQVRVDDVTLPLVHVEIAGEGFLIVAHGSVPHTVTGPPQVMDLDGNVSWVSPDITTWTGGDSHHTWWSYYSIGSVTVPDGTLPPR